MRGLVTVAAGIVAALSWVAAGSAAASHGEARCLKAIVPLAAGDVPVSSQFAEVRCPARRIAPTFRYDRIHRITRVARGVAHGEIVRIFPEFGRDLVRPGQQLILVVSTGQVRVEQPVEAMQTAAPRQRLFVRRKDGRVISTVYEGRGP